jgi:hypothetical protein
MELLDANGILAKNFVITMAGQTIAVLIVQRV